MTHARAGATRADGRAGVARRPGVDRTRRVGDRRGVPRALTAGVVRDARGLRPDCRVVRAVRRGGVRGVDSGRSRLDRRADARGVPQSGVVVAPDSGARRTASVVIQV